MRHLAALALVWAGAASFDTGAADKKVALVLSGGGARGLAHIGVLKVLRDARVPVDFIVATSMGSIVGGAYAAGHTPEEMERLVRSADWDRIFADRAPREFLSFRRKEDDLRLIGKSELGLKRDGVVLPRGALGSQNLEEFLRQLSAPASDARTLNDLPILFRAVATDLVTGEQVVLADVPLSVAMRASMSVPGAFAPTQVDGRLLGDGGLVRNLPVEVAREMGADVIIAVNVGTPLLPRDALTSAFGVAQQMINILTEQNVGISLGMLLPEDVLISPELGGVSFVDFERGEDLIRRGEAAGRAVAQELAALSWDPARYAAWEGVRTRRPQSHDRPVASIVVQGTQITNPEAIRRELASRADVVEGSKVNDEQLVTAARILHGWGDFERVDVRTQLTEGRRNVIVDLDEKPWGPNYLRLGGRAVSDFQTDARFALTLQHTRTWVNSWGAEWRNELTVGDTRRFATSFFQPLFPGSPWFTETQIEALKFNSDQFDLGYRRTDRVTHSINGVTGTLGLRLGTSGVLRVGAGYERYRTSPLIGTTFEATRDEARLGFAGFRFDTIDDSNFPRRGYVVEGIASSYRYSGDNEDPVQAYQVAVLKPWTWDRLTVLAIVNGAKARDDRGGFGLGGFLSLSGTPVGAVSGSELAMVSGLAYYRIGELLPRAIGRSVYAGFSLEAGNAWRQSSNDSRELKKAASVFVGLDSILGPMYFAWGRTFGGDSAFYLFLGRPTDQLTGGR
ncbi:MAG TPA: patatin-like phospholipase family protein [Usitatibacter sp.]|nr:patatin-like phospholipase family protein [Usitatibacter sp.]